VLIKSLQWIHFDYKQQVVVCNEVEAEHMCFSRRFGWEFDANF
jgi:hypothetical protein